eukprot:2760679-Rhodomonas_salina.4
MQALLLQPEQQCNAQPVSRLQALQAPPRDNSSLSSTPKASLASLKLQHHPHTSPLQSEAMLMSAHMIQLNILSNITKCCQQLHSGQCYHGLGELSHDKRAPDWASIYTTSTLQT